MNMSKQMNEQKQCFLHNFCLMENIHRLTGKQSDL